MLAAIERDERHGARLRLAEATRLVTLKLVGYVAAVNKLAAADYRVERQSSCSAAWPRTARIPGPPSGQHGQRRDHRHGHSLAVELAPIRCNAIHPARRRHPYWSDKGEPALVPVRKRTPSRRLVAMEDIVDAVVFLLENRSVNGENLHVDGGWLLL